MRTHAAALATEPEPRHAETGEHRLLAALLALAIADARHGRFGAREWLDADEENVSAAGWSFRAVCEWLAVDPAWARAQVARSGPSRRPAMRRTRRLRAAA